MTSIVLPQNERATRHASGMTLLALLLEQALAAVSINTRSRKQMAGVRSVDVSYARLALSKTLLMEATIELHGGEVRKTPTMLVEEA